MGIPPLIVDVLYASGQMRSNLEQVANATKRQRSEMIVMGRALVDR